MRPIFLLFLFLSCSAAAGAQNFPAWLQGKWTGMGQQSDSEADSWTMSLVVTADKISVNYPSLNCSGHWTTLDTVLTDKSIRFVETITRDNTVSCAQGEHVLVKYKNERQVLVLYSHDFNPANAIAVVLLNRQP